MCETSVKLQQFYLILLNKASYQEGTRRLWVLSGHDINLYLASMRDTLKQCLILSTIILVAVSETIAMLMFSTPSVLFAEGLVILSSIQSYILPCHVIYNCILKIEFLIYSRLVNLESNCLRTEEITLEVSFKDWRVDFFFLSLLHKITSAY